MLLLAGSMTGYAQSDCFDYEDSEETIINGLTAKGLAASSLTIPKEVTAVSSGAFSSSSAKVSALIIEAGGNPTFGAGLFGTNDNPLDEIQILGSSMTVANITALLTSLGAQGALSTVYIAGYSGAWSNISVTDVLTGEVSVTLPAALVTDQQFGNAKVYGRFELAKELVTFCGNATFEETDDSSNMLFYVADECNKAEGYIHIQRVRYVASGEGVLIHNAKGTSTSADLLRYDGAIPSAQQTLYNSNMFKGVTEPTLIGKTDGDKTNLVLSNGAFHPTSGGTIGANKAYLQVPTDALAAQGMLTIDFSEETGIVEMRNEKGKMRNEKGEMRNGSAWYTLDGRKLNSKPTTKGLYIINGKKYVIR
jgi:hypothetical protein